MALASKVFDGLGDKTVLLVGAGEMGELAARHLKQAGATRLFVANRTLSRAEALAAEVGAHRAALRGAAHAAGRRGRGGVLHGLARAPLHPGERGRVGKARASSARSSWWTWRCPGTSLPRWAELDWVHAYDVDDIQKFVADNAAARAEEAAEGGRARGPGGGPLRA